MKKLNLIISITLYFFVIVGCKKETSCTFVYSGWASCSNNIQTRTYTSSPSGCTGPPPADSIKRSCITPCYFFYSSWSLCSNNVQTRMYTSVPSLCTGKPPADSIQRSCVVNLIAIGTQTWTTKNLDVAIYRNGDSIPEAKDNTAWANLTTGAWCYYANNTANGTTYGKLYNWYAVNDPRGLAPNGYHIPTDEEWTTLTTYLGGEQIAGGKMKEAGTSHWLSPNTAATNSSCFAGLPGGGRIGNGDFTKIGANGNWWSSSESSAFNAWFRYLSGPNGTLGRDYYYEHGGISVRCLKD